MTVRHQDHIGGGGEVRAYLDRQNLAVAERAGQPDDVASDVRLDGFLTRLVRLPYKASWL